MGMLSRNQIPSKQLLLIIGSDGLDPIFVQLCEILVTGGNLVTFVV